MLAMARLVWLAALLPALCACLEVAARSSLGAELAETKIGPVNKVIAVLKDMLKTMEKEQEQDEDIYDKLACWCATNEKEKTKSIMEAKARIDMLQSSIEEGAAASARLSTEIKNLEKEVAKNQAALDKAKGIRTKELAEFNAEEKDLLGSISALKSAVTVLSKHHGDSLLQTTRSNMRGVATTIQREMQKNAPLLKGVFSHKEHRLATAFIQATLSEDYAPQSGEIFGILTTMKETFEQNLALAQKEEADQVKAFEELKAAKEAEISAGQDQLDSKTQELAETDEALGQAKVDIKDTAETLEKDEQFMKMLKEKCSTTDAEWEKRQKMRQMEMEAVGKALSMLNSDDAHDLFSASLGFVQKASRVKANRRTMAAKVLSSAAQRVHSPRLSQLAYQVKLDSFTRVKKAIDDMVTALLKEKQEEIDHKEFCVEEFHQNKQKTEKKQDEKADFEASIDDLSGRIKELKDAIATLKSEVAELKVQHKQAGENREKENMEFQQTIADQRATQKLLQATLAVLQDFYEKKAKAAFAQVADGQDPPPGFDEYKKNEQSGGVMKMIQEIINDAKSMEDEAIRSEEDAQKSYEDFTKETNASIEAKTKDLANKSEDKAKAEADLVEAKEGLAAVTLELEQLANYKAELNDSCDFVMKNFDVRQTARDEEIEALKQAKAILSGAKFDEFLQTA